ncbi:MAG TPA: carboxylating nicotinate-nucleotide diphosphorylase [Ignavibacteria bacterium]|nr:carboxylating nicotinate-nucleotide diphosphorylase [Bacteroidota bacterium]HRE10934.1 carboxylating nicotinate-nucleotide diphosphorylase [Ignavibacteria bacterium]HRF66717.1 carboxylating nicotinate-nucleotide diphosphorylase [Ignavibacteria bacterium]HRJ04062.1 carboxylating nicotinate-nucleotide diphosphorylase [Ignavibacteria bacterium]
MELKEYYKIYTREIDSKIKQAITEDKITSDVTTNLVLAGKAGSQKLKAVLLCKQECILAGIEIFKKTYRLIDKNAKFKQYAIDGQRVKKGSKVLEVTASRSVLLRGERTALNFLQRMSGIATMTNSFVKQLKDKNAKILHTRKTTPNFRVFEAAAVKTGGGDFHRLNLSSAVMIKDNHIEALGGMSNTMDLLLRKNIPYRLKQKFEIEVKSFRELDEVIKFGRGLVEIVMLDNFKPAQLKKAIALLKASKFKIELSGGINNSNFAKYQQKGVDFYSIGALTHSYKSSDFSLEF